MNVRVRTTLWAGEGLRRPGVAESTIALASEILMSHVSARSLRIPGVLVCVGLLVLAGRLPEPCRASDEAARAMLFGDDSLANVLELRRRTARLGPTDRWPLLYQAVLPAGRREIRIDIDFAPAHVSQPIAEALQLHNGWQQALNALSPGRSGTGGNLLSPAIDLVETARELGRLDDLRQALRERTPEVTTANADGPIRTTKAFDILLQIAGGEFESACERIADFVRITADGSVESAERGPEAVVIWYAASQAPTRRAVQDLVFLVYEQARGSQGPRSERWHRQVYGIKSLLEWLDDPTLQHPAPTPALERWQPSGRTTAATNGNGFPLASWDVRPGTAMQVTGHDGEFLYYTVPLVGDFTVEADTSTFNYRDIRLGYGGCWAGPGYDLKTVLNGNFRSDLRMPTLDPPLPDISEPMRVRLDVRNGRHTTFINGRAVFETENSASNPWLTLFGYWYTHGWVRNLRITGNPTVPDVIPLATRRDLPGWVPYFDESAGTPESDWRLVESLPVSLPANASPSSGPILLGDRDPELIGSSRESLLRYHRPFLEDGIIRYQFYYQPEEYVVHPALGRCAFLLTPAGVQRHQITDGKFERCGLSPDNREPLDDQEQVEQQLPLRAGDWNDVGLQVSGDEVRVLLNGQLVARQPIAMTSRRSFGVFHFADRSQALVRNLRWRGDWPRTLPPPRKQLLAADDVEALLAGPDLPAVFEHDFANGIPLDRFHVIGEGWQQNFEQRADGAFLNREGAEGYQRYEIIPQLTVAGDFDIVAAFSDFEADIASGGDANIQLLIGLAGRRTDCRLYRKFSRFANKQFGEQIVQAGLFETRDGQTYYTFPRSEPMAWSAGCLRLVRRGTQLHYLYAAEDSETFQHLYSTEVPDNESRPEQLRLIVETHKPGNVRVTWRSLTVRAERLSGLALAAASSSVELDEQRAAMPDHIAFDLGDEDDRRYLSSFGDFATIEPSSDGILLSVPGFDAWRSAGLRSRVALRGDFDATLSLDVPQLEPTAPGQESCVYLQAELDSDSGRLVQAKYAISRHGQSTTEMTLRRKRPGGDFEYIELGTLPAESIDRLRIARRGAMAYVLFQTGPTQPPQLLGRLDVGTEPIPLERLQAIVHTGGAGRETMARFRRLSLAADELIVAPPTAP